MSKEKIKGTSLTGKAKIKAHVRRRPGTAKVVEPENIEAQIEQAGVEVEKQALADVIAEIRVHHRTARFALKQQMRLERAMQSHVVFNELGADPNDKSGLKKKFGEAAKRFKEALDDPNDPLYEIAVANSKAVEPFENVRSKHEKAMTKLAQSLPIWTDWGFGIRGFGAFGLAQIIAECGDLSNYATVSKVWKRLGLAVMDGKRQGAPGSGATNADWIAHGYSGARRSIVWNIGQSLFKHQSAKIDKETEIVVAEAGHYRALYDARKLYERPRVQTDGHAHNRAVRYMEKMFIADLWSAWRQTTANLETTTPVSAAENRDGEKVTSQVNSITGLPLTVTPKSKSGVKAAGRRLKEAA